MSRLPLSFFMPTESIKRETDRLVALTLFYVVVVSFLPLQAQQTLTLHENLVTNEVPSLWNISLATNTPKDYEEIQLKLEPRKCE
jgi:hypothetical protein